MLHRRVRHQGRPKTAEITLTNAFQFLTQTILFITAALTLVAYLRHGGRERATIALMFGSLGASTVIGWLRQAVPGLPGWVQAISTLLLLAHPFLMVRVAQLFRRVPRSIVFGILGLMLLSYGLYVPFLARLPAPPWITAVVILYFAAGELYAMGALVAGARRSHGVARQRLRFAAVGAGMLGLLILVAGLHIFLPATLRLPAYASSALAFVTIFAFYLAFSPPQWLVRAWRNDLLLGFLQRSQQGTFEQRTDQAVSNLADAGFFLVGPEATGVFQIVDGHLAVHRLDSAGKADERTQPLVEDLLLDGGGDDRPVVFRSRDAFGPLGKSLSEDPTLQTLIAVPVQARGDRFAVLVMVIDRPPLFLDETLLTLQLLARQVATAFEVRRLSRAQGLLAAIVESSEDAIISKDLSGRITSWNEGGHRLFGYTAEEIVGKPGSILLGPDQEAEEQALISRIAAGEQISHMETTRLRKDGSLVPVSISLSPIRDARGRAVGISKVIRDITEQQRQEDELRRAKESAETAARAKAEFLANMSHEIRTPMNAILGMSSLLMDTRLNEEQKEFAETIRTSSEHLITIINDILDFSKIESGRLELEAHAFHLSDCLEESIELVSARAREKGLELAYSVESDVPNWFIGDVGRVRQVLVNLLGNAIKFTEKGEVSLIVGGKPLEGGRFDLLASVRDTGIGIAPENRDRLFRSFSQADASTTRRYGGTGLGLAISRQLVTLMGGQIWFDSEVGKGSTFHFTLPLAVAPDPPDGPLGPIRELQGAKALVVDDNPTNIRLLTVLGERWGMVVRSTQDPNVALTLASGEDAFDVALLDHQMPGLDGIALAARIRDLPHRARLPLLLLSSTGYFGPKAPFSRAHFSRIIIKPLRQSQLRDAILQAINPSHVRVRRSAKEEPPKAETSQLRVLLAEDNATNQLVATKMFRKLGVEPQIVTNGQEAIAAIERETFDVVFMDVHMPVMDGLEATRRICARWARPERPRIVAMTAEAMHGDRERCLEAGMDDYVPKPVKLSDLQRVLDAVRPAGNGA